MKSYRFLALLAIAGITSTVSFAQSAQASTFTESDHNVFLETSNLKDQNPALFNEFSKYVNTERLKIEDQELLLLDPTSLFWDGVDPVDVYFMNEGAGYRNQLLVSVNGGPKQMLFDDVSSPESILKNSDGPLALGDGGTLGEFDGPTQFEFFIKANGANGGSNVYGADAAANPDGLEHVLAYEYLDKATGDNWIILGFEDLYGKHYDEGGKSDRDFNDVVFAVRGLQGKPAAETPEASTVLGLLALGAAVTISRRFQVSA